MLVTRWVYLLTAALCVMLLEDRVWVRRLPARHRPPDYRSRPPDPAAELLLAPFAALVLLNGAVNLALRYGDRGDLPGPVVTLMQWTRGFRSLNHYGLFAVMTTSRPELELMGSVDGDAWRTYEFRWKPGAAGERPRLIPLHMPRLDWRMWFAALGDYRAGSWFDPFARRVLEGSPQALGLMGPDPFGGYPPKYLRAMRYQYRFTTPDERAETGDWWVREPDGAWSPMFSRE